MPFDPDVKATMFIRCNRMCCLCLKQCGINIEAAHIIDEAAGGSNDEGNGIPLCFDCHQEIGSYNVKHPRGNKIRPDELRARRDRVYSLVEKGQIATLRPANLSRLFERPLELNTQDTKDRIRNPSIGELLVAIDRLRTRDDWFLTLCDRAWDNAFIQACPDTPELHWVEYRDGATQMQYRTPQPISIEAVRLAFLTYMHQGDELIRHAIEWQDVTATLP